MTVPVPTEPADLLASWLAARGRVFTLTGAGCSTGSGIPDYRDENGNWKQRQPVSFRDFVDREHVRRRYWARSRVGWNRIRDAAPGATHRALSELERLGVVTGIVTQNVDRLHQRAGSRNVIDLHGSLDWVDCLGCGRSVPREAHQERLDRSNPDFVFDGARFVADGDAELQGADYRKFIVPDCASCGGLLKPAVVFFGESVPKGKVDAAMAQVDASDGLLVIGSSLMVFSGLRFVRRAASRGVPVAILNLGRTRADASAELRIHADSGRVLSGVVQRLR